MQTTIGCLSRIVSRSFVNNVVAPNNGKEPTSSGLGRPHEKQQHQQQLLSGGSAAAGCLSQGPSSNFGSRRASSTSSTPPPSYAGFVPSKAKNSSSSSTFRRELGDDPSPCPSSDHARLITAVSGFPKSQGGAGGSYCIDHILKGQIGDDAFFVARHVDSWGGFDDGSIEERAAAPTAASSAAAAAASSSSAAAAAAAAASAGSRTAGGSSTVPPSTPASSSESARRAKSSGASMDPSSRGGGLQLNLARMVPRSPPLSPRQQWPHDDVDLPRNSGSGDSYEDRDDEGRRSRGRRSRHLSSSSADVIGVADGVGGWRQYGVDPGQFSLQLMRSCERLVKAGYFVSDQPDRLLAQGFWEMQQAKSPAVGSSTACLAMLSHADGKLYTANIGDSGLIVVRAGKVVHRSSEQQHSFNTPFQLSLPPTEMASDVLSDRPEAADRYEFNVEDGDVIVLATDGMFDNVPDDLLIEQIDQISGCTNDVAKVQACANSIALIARSLSRDDTFLSPFSRNARLNGYRGAVGGKEDDITVVLAAVSLGGGGGGAPPSTNSGEETPR